jgi:hypothetical protein
MKYPSSRPKKIKRDTKLFKVGLLLLVLGDITSARATGFGTVGIGLRGLDIDLLTIGAGISPNGLYFHYKPVFDLPNTHQKLYFDSRSGLRWDQSYFITESDLNIGFRQPLSSSADALLLDLEGGFGTRQLWLERGRENQPYFTFNLRFAFPLLFPDPVPPKPLEPVATETPTEASTEIPTDSGSSVPVDPPTTP